MNGRLTIGRGARRDRVLIALVFAYFLLVALWNVGSTVHSSAERVAGGQVWLLLTSALDVNGRFPGLQLAVTAAVTAFVILREGPLAWWLAVLAGHVVSALLAYGVIGFADLLGSDSAERVANDPDYGISCVLAGSIGALLASGLVGRRESHHIGGSDPGGFATSPIADRVALALGAIGALASLTVAYGWYDMEHPIAFALGAVVIWFAHRRDAP